MTQRDDSQKGASTFAPRLIAWQRAHGRHDLPWSLRLDDPAAHDLRHPPLPYRDPYRVWLSEIMLQQTQVRTVIPYYQAFLAAFPTLAVLAAAPLDRVLARWSGLGYYSRARNLHRCACEIMAAHRGQFPRTAVELVQLPGIGPSTAAAIAGFCFGERSAILDGNVQRVLARWAGIEGDPAQTVPRAALWTLAHRLLPARADQMPAYHQATMDLGALCCTRREPSCLACPLAEDCVAYREERVTELPTPRIRAVRPTRHTTLLLLCETPPDHPPRWLLERRPPSGIWGGLWSLPEAEAPDADAPPDPRAPQEISPALAARLAAYGCQLLACQHLPVLRHGFTHFQLCASPLLCQVQRVPAAAPLVGTPDAGTTTHRQYGAKQGSAAAETSFAWLSREQALALGLPAPIRRLLATDLQPSRMGGAQEQKPGGEYPQVPEQAPKPQPNPEQKQKRKQTVAASLPGERG